MLWKLSHPPSSGGQSSQSCIVAILLSNDAAVAISLALQQLLKSVWSFVHNILLVGSPGAGKTLLARAMPGILPEMSIEESLDVTRIYSVADQLPAGTPLIKHRPFRSPHHTISHAGLVGGGNIPKPGEISLAHRGVLFLDEFPEFGTRVLEVMRQPMEDKVVTISRAKGSLTFSANFQLITAMNPCPCGYYGDTQKPCSCAYALVTKYQKRISGPLLDRIDIHIEVPRVDYEKLSGDRVGESSECIRARVQAARNIQQARFTNPKSLLSNNGSSNDTVCNANARRGSTTVLQVTRGRHVPYSKISDQLFESLRSFVKTFSMLISLAICATIIWASLALKDNKT